MQKTQMQKTQIKTPNIEDDVQISAQARQNQHPDSSKYEEQ